MTARQHQALYRRWRAQTFGEIVGQEAVVATLRNAVRSEQVAHALLFVGPRGTGKTSMARIVAKALNCTNLQDGEPCDRCPSCVAIREGRALDVIEIDAATNRGIDSIKDLRDRLQYAPSDLRRKVYILDEAHQITRDGWNALLKSLEEPPDFVAFIFASTHPEEFPLAILSRVQRYDFKPLTVSQIEGKLRTVLAAEGRTAQPEAVSLVARLAAGGMRDAESMLDQLLTAGLDPLTAEQVRELLGIVEAETVDAFLVALAGGDALAGVRILDALEERGRDLRGFLGQIVEAIRTALVAGLSARAASSSTDPRALAAAARRLAEIDPTRNGPGGLRFQLELALLAPLASGQATAAPTTPAPRADPPKAPPPPKPEGPKAKPPAAPAPAPATVAAALAVPASDALAALHAQWPEIVAWISRNPATKPLIAVCRPIAVDGNVVTLGFPESQAFLKDALERRRTILEQGVGQFLGREVAVRCVATNLDLRPPSDPDADRLVAEARRIFAEDLVDVGEVN